MRYTRGAEVLEHGVHVTNNLHTSTFFPNTPEIHIIYIYIHRGELYTRTVKHSILLSDTNHVL